MPAVATLDLHQAVVNFWVAKGLDSKFTAYWGSSDVGSYLPLEEEEAAAGTPHPYCIFQQQEGTTVSRMTREGEGAATTNRIEQREVPWVFIVHAKDTTNLSAKEVAARLVEEIMKVFGGHPTEAPNGKPNPTNGGIVEIRYVSELGAPSGDSEYRHQITYLITTDVPMAD